MDKPRIREAVKERAESGAERIRENMREASSGGRGASLEEYRGEKIETGAEYAGRKAAQIAKSAGGKIKEKGSKEMKKRLSQKEREGQQDPRYTPHAAERHTTRQPASSGPDAQTARPPVKEKPVDQAGTIKTKERYLRRQNKGWEGADNGPAHGRTPVNGQSGKQEFRAEAHRGREYDDVRHEPQAGASKQNTAFETGLEKQQTGRQGKYTAQRTSKRIAGQPQRNPVRRAARTFNKQAKAAGKVKAAGKKTVKSAKRTVRTARRTVRTSGKAVKTTARTAREATQATVRAAKAAAHGAKLAAKAAHAAAKLAVKAAVTAVKAIAAAVKALIAAIAAGAGWLWS